MNKKITILIILICTLVVGIGVSLAYFAVNNQNDGNEANLNVTTERLGSILWTGTKVFTSYDLLPGQMGIQEFTIEKNSDNGIGIYEIDLAGVLPSEFGTDIEISLYKTTDPINNNVTVDVADPTLENETIYQEDSLNITGEPELVYQGTLTNNSQIILEQADFDVTTLEKTTYYLVYHYKNNGNQDSQQGLSFSGTISVRIINEKMSFSESIIACNDTAANCIVENSEKSDELVYDETADNNLRYIGADPNNYVWFNDELWRIIGVMNNIEDGAGNKETRLKIIRSEPIGTYTWDNKASGTGSSTSSLGSNDWGDSTLQQVLNEGAYYNRTSGNCPYGQNGATTACDFSSSGLISEAKSMISNVVWNLGGVSSTSNPTSTFYTSERGTTVHSGRPTKWTGQIGLIYPSDYGYATSGGSNIDRNACLATELYYWYRYSDCYTNDWLYKTETSQWTLTPTSSSSYAVFAVGSNGYVDYDFAGSTGHAVSPALYLTSNVRISGGTGTSLDPFELSL